MTAIVKIVELVILQSRSRVEVTLDSKSFFHSHVYAQFLIVGTVTVSGLGHKKASQEFISSHVLWLLYLLTSLFSLTLYFLVLWSERVVSCILLDLQQLAFWD